MRKKRQSQLQNFGKTPQNSIFFKIQQHTRKMITVTSSSEWLQESFHDFVSFIWIPGVIVLQTIWLLTPILWTKLWTEHYDHGNTLYAQFRESATPLGHLKFALRGGWRFVILYFLGWVLMAGAVLHRFQIPPFDEMADSKFAVSGTKNCSLLERKRSNTSTEIEHQQ